eukprot:447822-Prymnesium_polylepis.1
MNQVDNTDALGMVPIQRNRMQDERVFLTLYNMMKTAQRSGQVAFPSRNDWSVAWFKEPYEMTFTGTGVPQWNTTELTKGRMLCSTSVGAYRR